MNLNSCSTKNEHVPRSRAGSPVGDSSQTLELRFEDWDAVGTSQEGLRLAVSRDGDSIVDEAFMDVASALAFFSSLDLDLGLFATEAGSSAIQIALEMGATTAGDQFIGQIVLVAVPEPSTGVLMLFGLAVLSRQRGHARRS